MKGSFVHLLLPLIYLQTKKCLLLKQGRKGNHNQAEGAKSEAQDHEQRDAKRLAGYVILLY